jgi:hypothetical protein
MSLLLRLTVAAAATLALSACSKTDTAPVPAHNDVAASMPDAASTPGAVGPATAAPHTDVQPVPTTPKQAVPPIVSTAPNAPAPAPTPK